VRDFTECPRYRQRWGNDGEEKSGDLPLGPNDTTAEAYDKQSQMSNEKRSGCSLSKPIPSMSDLPIELLELVLRAVAPKVLATCRRGESTGVGRWQVLARLASQKNRNFGHESKKEFRDCYLHSLIHNHGGL